ncbi:MAG TPA: hypothetical protein VNX25_10755 [Verrucomicrobiae bacterium]|nr:hypothetical protein [Verrucomicrobiae bacterium]
MGKQITVTFYRQNHLRPDWRRDLSSTEFEFLFLEMEDDLRRFGITVTRVDDQGVSIDVSSYADVLNAVRISSPSDGITNLCIGHIIGKSPNLDLTEDLRRAVNRIAFAPETVPPDDHNRRTCHNCGCGC